MIKIDDRYVITADAWGATLKKIIKPDDADEALLKRFGIERSTRDKIRIVGHYVTLEAALKGYMQERYNDAARSDVEYTLSEILEMSEAIKKVIDDLAEKIERS